MKLLTDRDVWHFLGGALSQEDAGQRADRIIADAEAASRWSIRHMEMKRCIGLIELTQHHDGDDTEISYQLLPTYWNQGIAYEAVLAVIAYALLEAKVRRLIAETQEANAASRKLLQRCGMKEYRRIQRFGAAQIISGIEASDLAIKN